MGPGSTTISELRHIASGIRDCRFGSPSPSEDHAGSRRTRESGASSLGMVAAVRESVIDGSWPRLRAAGRTPARGPFYDESRNRSRTWCSMQVCGNRAKGRTFRERHGSD